MLLGCIADDFTGASDIANALSKGGMKVCQFIGTPRRQIASEVDAGVVSLKTRTAQVEDAVGQSLDAARVLLAHGCRQFMFKYCSTFDSTPMGNIGPVAEALAQFLGVRRVVVCPAFPQAGRTVYQGHLFVNDRLLSRSGMRNHPLTPMTEPDIRHWLRQQTEGPVGHIGHEVVRQGHNAIREALAARDELLIVVDALYDEDLIAIGEACCTVKLVTGASGIAQGIPQNFARLGLLDMKPEPWNPVAGPAICLAGSCSETTLNQIAIYAREHPAMAIDAKRVITGLFGLNDVMEFAALHRDAAPLIYTSVEPAKLKRLQDSHDLAELADALERLFASIAKAARAQGFRRFVVAGGETSGAVVTALGLAALRVGPELDLGIPLLAAIDDEAIGLVLKSGNFGRPDFFMRAVERLEMTD